MYINSKFVRNNDYIKFVDGAVHYSSSEIEELWKDLLQKEANGEWGPQGTYIAQVDITYLGFTHEFLSAQDEQNYNDAINSIKII
jgi:hypothetical protein